MKQVAVIILAISLIGCATGGGKKVNSPDASFYTKNSRPVLVQSSEAREGNCPSSSKIEKEDNWKELVTMANACLSQNKFTQLENIGNRLAKIHHLGPWGAYYLSLAAEGENNVERALWMIELALKKAPEEGLLYYQAGRIYWSMNEPDKAVEAFEKAVRFRKGLVEGHLLLGQIYYRDQEFSAAKQHFSKVLKEDSDHFMALVGLAECELEDGNRQVAADLVGKAIRLQPRSLELRMRQAHIYEHHLEQFESALAAYKKIDELGRRKKLNEPVAAVVMEKIKMLETKLAKETGEQLSSRQPAKEEGVSK